MSSFEFRRGPVMVFTAFTYVGVLTAGCYLRDGLEQEAIPLGAPVYAVTTNTAVPLTTLPTFNRENAYLETVMLAAVGAFALAARHGPPIV
jgi:hypothetical protein